MSWNVVKNFERATGQTIPYKVVDGNRDGISAMPTLPRRRWSLDGWRRGGLRRCVGMPGIGRSTIPMAMNK